MGAVGSKILVTGASGRLGQMLRRFWPQFLPQGLHPVWQGRGAVPDVWLHWDMLREPYGGPALTGGVVLNLAGVTDGAASTLNLNADLALAACRAAAQAGARHLFVTSSAAVYGPGAGDDLTEDAPPQPAGAYGQAKLDMERRVREWHLAQDHGAPGLTILRIGNVVGADRLIGGARPGAAVMLDPVDGSSGGPLRSYIGPRSLAVVLARLCAIVAERGILPVVLNIAAAPPVSMAALLTSAGFDWRFGPANPAVVARVVLGTERLQRLVILPPHAGDAGGMVAEWRAMADGRA